MIKINQIKEEIVIFKKETTLTENIFEVMITGRDRKMIVKNHFFLPIFLYIKDIFELIGGEGLNDPGILRDLLQPHFSIENIGGGC